MDKKQIQKQNMHPAVRTAIWLAVLVALCVFLVITLRKGVTFKMAIVPLLLGAGCLVAMVVLRNPLVGGYILVAGLPILAADFLNTRVINIAGMKLDILLSAGVVACLFLNQCASSMGKREKRVVLIVLALFIVANLRGMQFALPNLSTEETVTAGTYFRSYFLKDFLYFMPFIIICAYLNEEKQVHALLNALFFGVVILGIFISVIFIIHIRPLGDYETTKAYYTLFYDGHPNDIVNFFLVAFPVMMGYAMHKKTLWHFAGVGVCLVAIVLLFSRTVYVLAAVAVVLFFLMEKKVGWLIGAGVAGVATIPFLPDTIKKYAMTLVSGNNLNTITSGRTENIWRPLLLEMKGYSLSQMLFGYGSYGIFKTNSFRGGDIFTVAHAHNVYLTTVLETGLLGLAAFVGIFVYYLFKFWRVAKKSENEFFRRMLRCICLSLLLYLARGFSGGFFLPQLSNMYLWVVLGIGVVILKAEKGEKSGVSGKQA